MLRWVLLGCKSVLIRVTMPCVTEVALRRMKAASMLPGLSANRASISSGRRLPPSPCNLFQPRASMPPQPTSRKTNGRWVDALLLGMVLVSVVGLIYTLMHH